MSTSEEQKGTGFFSKPQNIILLVLALVILGAAAVIVSMQIDPTVAVVNGKRIKRSELYAVMYMQGGSEALDSLVDTQLILQEGEKRGIKVGNKEIDEEIDSIIEEHYGGDREQFESILELQNFSLDELRDRMRLDLTLEQIIEDDLKISDKEAREYFKENRELFNVQEEVKARHILVETKKEALDVIARLEKGEDFAELAGELSMDPGSKEQGGDLGFFPRKVMAEEFEKVAFDQKKGEISAPVETSHGYHVIETLDHKKARKVTFDEVADDVNEKIKADRAPLLIQELLERLKSEAVIDIRD